MCEIPASCRSGPGGQLSCWTTHLEVTVKYALLIYSAPGAREQAGPVPTGVIDDWIAYARVRKDSGSLPGAEQLAETDTAAPRPNTPADIEAAAAGLQPSVR